MESPHNVHRPVTQHFGHVDKTETSDSVHSASDKGPQEVFSSHSIARVPCDAPNGSASSLDQGKGRGDTTYRLGRQPFMRIMRTHVTQFLAGDIACSSLDQVCSTDRDHILLAERMSIGFLLEWFLSLDIGEAIMRRNLVTEYDGVQREMGLNRRF